MHRPVEFEHDAGRFIGTPRRRYYTGPNLARAQTIDDLRARCHRLLPRLALEYLEGGAEDEQTLRREVDIWSRWSFIPRFLKDVSQRTTHAPLLDVDATLPLLIAPTGLNGLFKHHADLALAQGAAQAGVPFIQSTMSNDLLEDVAATPGLRHWWQLYVFGGEEIWQEMLGRAERAGCEALVLTVNAQTFGRREWSQRLTVGKNQLTLSTILNAALHPRWLFSTLILGLPSFANVVDFIPKDRRGFFDSAFWIREQMPKSLDWSDVWRIRARWKRPFFLKGLLHPDDVARAIDCGVDGIMLGAHGGRQLDGSVSAADMIEQARAIAGDKVQLYLSGGVRRGTDILKARALGADAVLAGRAPLYGLCAGGADGVARAVTILAAEVDNAMAQLGVSNLASLNRDMLFDHRAVVMR